MMADGTRAAKQLTIADLCLAIEGREAPFTVRDGRYELSVREVRRLQRRRAGNGPHHDSPLGAFIADEAGASEMGSLA